MAWFKVDDQISFHAKTVAAGNAAFGAWVRMGAWSSAHLTDGHVPASIARTMASPAELRRLIDVRFLDEVDGGFLVHGFLEWNPSGEAVRAKREARQKAGRLGGERSGETRRTKQDGGEVEAEPKQEPSKSEANTEAIASPIASTLAKQTRTPSPSPSQDHTACDPTRAHAASPAPVQSQLDPPMSDEATAILAALRARRELRSVARYQLAERLATHVVTLGGNRTLAYVLSAIDDAAEKAGASEDSGQPVGQREIANMLVGFVRLGRPRPSAEAARDERRPAKLPMRAPSPSKFVGPAHAPDADPAEVSQ